MGFILILISKLVPGHESLFDNRPNIPYAISIRVSWIFVFNKIVKRHSFPCILHGAIGPFYNGNIRWQIALRLSGICRPILCTLAGSTITYSCFIIGKSIQCHTFRIRHNRPKLFFIHEFINTGLHRLSWLDLLRLLHHVALRATAVRILFVKEEIINCTVDYNCNDKIKDYPLPEWTLTIAGFFLWKSVAFYFVVKYTTS